MCFKVLVAARGIVHLIAFALPIKLAGPIVAESLSMLLGKERVLPIHNTSRCAGISTTEVSGGAGAPAPGLRLSLPVLSSASPASSAVKRHSTAEDAGDAEERK